MPSSIRGQGVLPSSLDDLQNNVNSELNYCAPADPPGTACVLFTDCSTTYYCTNDTLPSQLEAEAEGRNLQNYGRKIWQHNNSREMNFSCLGCYICVCMCLLKLNVWWLSYSAVLAKSNSTSRLIQLPRLMRKKCAYYLAPINLVCVVSVCAYVLGLLYDYQTRDCSAGWAMAGGGFH